MTDHHGMDVMLAAGVAVAQARARRVTPRQWLDNHPMLLQSQRDAAELLEQRIELAKLRHLREKLEKIPELRAAKARRAAWARGEIPA